MEGKIDTSSLQKAIDWGVYLESHARKINSALDLTTGVTIAKVILEKIKKRALEQELYMRDIYRNQWHGLRDRKQVEIGLEMLAFGYR